jgi:serine/threonine protein kinase
MDASQSTLCVSCGHRTVLDGPDEPSCPRCGRSPLLLGRYRLLETLGQGSFATTFRARRLADGAEVAVKELLVHGLPGFKAEALFRREAEVLRQIDHPRVPRFHEQLIGGEGRWLALYLIHDLVEGETLAQELAHRRYEPSDVLEMMAELLEVLASLHALSPPVIHRDLKPENVVRRRSDGRLVLIDFGSVQAALAGPEGGSTIAGTFGFMAPEQLAGRASPASDVYAVGALAVTLLARQPPHALMNAVHRLEWQRALPDLPAPLAHLLGRMLEPRVERRASDAAALAREARSLLARGLTATRSLTPRWRTAALAAALLAAGVGAWRLPAARVAPPAPTSGPLMSVAPSVPPSSPLPPAPTPRFPRAWPIPSLDNTDLYPWTPGPSRCEKAGNCRRLEDDFEELDVVVGCQAFTLDRGESQIVTSTRHFSHEFGGERGSCQRQFLFGHSCRVTCNIRLRDVSENRFHEVAEAAALELRDRYGAETRYHAMHGRRYWTWSRDDARPPFNTHLSVDTDVFRAGQFPGNDIHIRYDTSVRKKQKGRSEEG